SISSSAQFLYSPGFILILASLACIGIFKMSLRQYGTAISDSVKTMIQAAPALLLAVPMAQVFINSGSADGTLAAMPMGIAQCAASIAGEAWPSSSPWLVALGAFIAGSHNVSNMMFSCYQFSTATQIGLGRDRAAYLVAL